MKTPHIVTAVLAAAAMMAGSKGSAMEYKLGPAPPMNSKGNTWSQGGRQRRNKTSQRSQRQSRKDCRRAHAAGVRHAFA